MNNKPLISIIIPVRNGARSLANCLESIKGQSYPSDLQELIISDGMSTDDTVKIAGSFGAKVVKNPKLTVGPGRNEGFKIAKGELIVFSDDDCVMDKDWLSNSIKYFEDEKVGGMSGPTITKVQGSWGEAIGLVFEMAAGSGISSHRNRSSAVKEVTDIPGCNAFYRRKALERVFPIDESLLTAEDVEMNRLVRDAGYKLLYVPDVKLWHYRRQTLSGFFRQMYRFAIGRLQVGRKDPGMLRIPHLLAGLALPLLMIAILLLFINDKIMKIYAGLVFAFAAAGFVYGLVKTRSIKTALLFPLVAITFITAWSAGFMKELISPIKREKKEHV